MTFEIRSENGRIFKGTMVVSDISFDVESYQYRAVSDLGIVKFVAGGEYFYTISFRGSSYSGEYWNPGAEDWIGG